MFSSLICMFFQWHVYMLCAYCHGTQAEDILRSLFSFSPHDPDRGGVQEEMEGTGGGINGARGGNEQS
jgi:hypothetical protein